MPEPSTGERDGGFLELQPASEADLPAVVELVNRAYGRAGEPGWSNAVAYLEGDRTNLSQLRSDLLSKPRGRLLIYRNAEAVLTGSAWIEDELGGVFYLGTLAVLPGNQNAGLGRRLLASVERWAEQHGAREIRMSVTDIRSSLIEWYIRRGYAATGEVEAFPYGDDRYGRPLRDDLAFVVLRKTLREDQG